MDCAYWSLETNKDAGWAYSDSVGFDAMVAKNVNKFRKALEDYMEANHISLEG